MKSYLYVILLLGILFQSSPSNAQVSIFDFPKNNQLYGRNLETNLGLVQVSGLVESNFIHEEIGVIVLRNNQLFSSHYVPAIPLDSFHFDIPIKAELANYSFILVGSTNGMINEYQRADKVVAGDAFIIQGQSNAEAKSRGESTSFLTNDFIRVYASGTQYGSALVNNDKWFIGQGDGNRFSNGNVGQWGMQFANELTAKHKIPVAIFNGAHAAQPIDFFQRPNDYATSVNSNYGRLYFRVTQSNLAEHVRAVFWSQGEKNGLYGFRLTSEEYMSYFDSLRYAWKEDFPNIEKYYIFQTHNGCNKDPQYLMPIKEAQRRLGATNQEIETISTAKMKHFSDDCHFNFTDGYELFGNRLFRIVDEDLYGGYYPANVHSPDIISAQLIFSTTVQISTTSPFLMSNAEPSDFEVHGLDSLEITHVYCAGSDIYITLSAPPIYPLEVSYLAPPQGDSGNFIVNGGMMEMLSFYHYPVQNVLSVEEEQTNLKIGYDRNQKSLRIITDEHIEQLELFSLNGQKIGSSFSKTMDLSDCPFGNYILKITSDQGIYHRKICIY